jgi:rare lipoprotein A
MAATDPTAALHEGSTRLAGLAALAIAAILAGCGTAPKPPPRSGGFYQDDGPPLQIPADILATPDAVPRVEPFHSGALRPYVALGRSYTPVTDDRPLVERGLASWYGRQFHGNRTSTGEIYDMFAMTAAHPTMPLPSYARVTNLNSGASVVVRVNDRGPFKDGRVIDLSYAAATRLGIAAVGTGEVEVRRITHTEIAAASVPPAAAAPAAPQLAPATAPAAAASTRWAVQLGAFRQEDNARALHEQSARALAGAADAALPADLRQPRIERDGELHRVLLGWLPDRESAAQLATRIALLLGRDTAIVVR